MREIRIESSNEFFSSYILKFNSMSHINIIYSSVNVLFHVENSLLEVESILKLGSGKKHLIRIFGCDQPYFIK